MRRLVVMQFLLDAGDLIRCLGALARETFVDRVDGDIDEPTSSSSVLSIPTQRKRQDQRETKLTSSPHPHKPSSQKASPTVPSTSTAACGCPAAWRSIVPWRSRSAAARPGPAFRFLAGAVVLCLVSLLLSSAGSRVNAHLLQGLVGDRHRYLL